MPAPVISTLVRLNIPFAVIHSDSLLGNDQFAIVMSRDGIKIGASIPTELSPTNRNILEIGLSEGDLRYLSSAYERGVFTQTVLYNKSGCVYELTNNSFLTYYRKILKTDTKAQRKIENGKIRERENVWLSDIEEAQEYVDDNREHLDHLILKSSTKSSLDSEKFKTIKDQYL